MDRMPFVHGEHAQVDITFLPSDKPVTEVPLSLVTPIVALMVVGLSGICGYGRRGNNSLYQSIL
jgi:hypothetical protein